MILLKDAAKQLVDTIAAEAAQMKQLPKPVQFGIVPFAASVNVGASNAFESWMDQDGHGADVRAAVCLKSSTLADGLECSAVAMASRSRSIASRDWRSLRHFVKSAQEIDRAVEVSARRGWWKYHRRLSRQ